MTRDEDVLTTSTQNRQAMIDERTGGGKKSMSFADQQNQANPKWLAENVSKSELKKRAAGNDSVALEALLILNRKKLGSDGFSYDREGYLRKVGKSKTEKEIDALAKENETLKTQLAEPDPWALEADKSIIPE